MRRNGIDRGVVLLIVMAAVLVATGVSVALAVRSDEISNLVADEGQLAMALTVELDDGSLITHVFLYQFSTGRGAMLHVPSQTGVVVRALNRVDSIDTAFRTEGMVPYVQQIAELFGTPVPFFVHLDEAGLEAVVDLLGGVPVFVTDLPNEGPEAVLIPAGDVVLDGAKALEYLRYEGEGERDRDRIVRRGRLILSLVEQLGERAEMLSGRAASRIVHSRMTTNLDRPAFVSLMRELAGVEKERMITRQIEGTLRRVGTDDEEKLLLFPHQEGRWLRESVRQIVDNLATATLLQDENIAIRVEVLNGTEVVGLASRTAELLRSYGFDVISVGNAASNDIERTRVIDRTGSGMYARRTADVIRAPRVDSEADPQAVVDVTVILGKDFDGRYVR